MRKLLCLAIVLSALASAHVGAAQSQRRKTPRFEDYRASMRRGRVTRMNPRSHPLARRYPTLMREQQRTEGVNFAGHYTLASVGCGTGCSITAVIDARDGTAYFPKELNGWTGIVGDYDPPEGEEPWEYRASSRLLRATGRPNIGAAGEERYGPSGIYYYVWERNRLRQVGFTPVGSYPEADPPANR